MNTPRPIQHMTGYTPVETMYSDGDVEQELLALFQQDDAAVQHDIDRLLAHTPAWPIRYHLSAQRWHLLDWLALPPAAHVLEIGAGCGALTGLFAQHAAHVDALEISERRAQIIAHRHRAHQNVQVLVGDLATMPADMHYDVIALIGVLEYAGRYHSATASHRDAYTAFLQDVVRHLKPGGHVIIAIENQLGLKYLAGYNEDHYGQPLVGIEDYPSDSGIRTFGRHELSTRLSEAGLSQQRWYYPFPDYKLPISVYSDDLLPGTIEHVALMYPTIDFSHPATPLFAEHRTAAVLQRNQMLPNFSNSFLVICQTSAL